MVEREMITETLAKKIPLASLSGNVSLHTIFHTLWDNSGIANNMGVYGEVLMKKFVLCVYLIMAHF